MKPYLVHTPKFVQRIFPKRVWAFPFSEKQVYLTFDDGPIPEVTPWVLSELDKYNAKATFFCIGDNIKKHPELFRRIISEGHSAGNHTFHHLNGWKTNTEDYIRDVLEGEKEMEKVEVECLNSEGQADLKLKIQNPKLFRPPYGKITSKQSRILQEKGYKIIMWEILSADFDGSISEEKCLQNVMKHINAGSIIVFHDSLKAEKNLRYVLPKVLNFLSERNMDSIAIEAPY